MNTRRQRIKELIFRSQYIFRSFYLSGKAIKMIGTPGQPWGDSEKELWRSQQPLKRSYASEVLAKIDMLRDRFTVEQYGALPYDADRYPLFAVRTPRWDDGKKTILVTGGVHGYETSGVQGALLFLETEALNYMDRFNIVVAPCVSPWGYETINRWTPLAVDPNRSFAAGGTTAESSSLIGYVNGLQARGCNIVAHFDLHETTDTDETIFSPTLAARDGKEFVADIVPDGLYLVGDSLKPEPAFQKAMIDGVRAVTHIAPADESGCLIGEPIAQEGVIYYPVKELGLCCSMTDAPYVTTTEIYPDSPKVDDANCNEAQVAVIKSGMEFILLQGDPKS